MGRHKRMVSATRPRENSDTSAAATRGDIWRPSIEPAHQERFDALAQYRPKIQVTDLAAIWPVAAAMIAQAPATTIGTDRKRLTQLCHLLAHDRDVHGGVDLRRALQRENVDHYIYKGHPGRPTPGSIRTYKSHLYRFGRILHPTEYPEALVTANRNEVRAPYSADEIRALYRHQHSLSDSLAGRLLAVLDLATGAGARSEEIATLTGASIHTIRARGEDITCVDIPSRRTGELRTVPIHDPAKGGRLLRRARDLGPDEWLLPGSRHNAVNGIRTTIRRRGVEITMSAVRLRHTWIVDLAQHGVPTALLLRLADLGDSHTLHDLTRWMRRYHPAEATEWIQEAMS